MYRHVWAKDFWTKEVYLGVRSARVARSSQGCSPDVRLLSAQREALGLDDDTCPAGRSPGGRDAAERLGRALASGALYARHADLRPEDRLAVSARRSGRWATRRSRVAGARVGQGEIESSSRVRSTTAVAAEDRQPAGESYVAHLSFARFPDLMPFPTANVDALLRQLRFGGDLQQER